jgi:putative ABC transport system permease protein
MRFSDTLASAFSGLARQKMRTVLTASGVFIGTLALVLIFALGGGVSAAIESRLARGDQLRQIMVNPGFGAESAGIPSDKVVVPGEMDEAKRRRIRKAVLSRRGIGNPQQKRTVLLTRDRMAELAAVPHVQSVLPLVQDRYRAAFGEKTQDVLSYSLAADNERFRARLIAGRFLDPSRPREVLVHEYLLYRWGIISDADTAAVVGKTLRLEHRAGGREGAILSEVLGGGRLDLNDAERETLRKLAARLPAKIPAVLEALDLSPEERAVVFKIGGRLAPLIPPAAGASADAPLFTEEFTIAGVIREFMEDDDIAIFEAGMSLHADVFFLPATAEELFFRVPVNRETGYPAAVVIADEAINARDVTSAIRGKGLTAISLGTIVEQVRTAVTIITLLVAMLGAIALLVAALGIVNTLIMSVVERTREIGIMKAVGARNAHVRRIFLIEGAVIGLLGGLLGLLAAWLLSFPADAYARLRLERETRTILRESLFHFPAWLALGAPVFAGLTATLAALLPARRAARVDPITALRHD